MLFFSEGQAIGPFLQVQLHLAHGHQEGAQLAASDDVLRVQGPTDLARDRLAQISAGRPAELSITFDFVAAAAAAPGTQFNIVVRFILVPQ